MPKIEFEFRDFWEVPRLIVCTVHGIELLLDSEFDETSDSYAPEYKVYQMPPELPPDQAASWANPDAPKPVYLGSIPISDLEFDPSLREQLESQPLIDLLERRRKETRKA